MEGQHWGRSLISDWSLPQYVAQAGLKLKITLDSWLFSIYRQGGSPAVRFIPQSKYLRGPRDKGSLRSEQKVRLLGLSGWRMTWEGAFVANLRFPTLVESRALGLTSDTGFEPAQHASTF